MKSINEISCISKISFFQNWILTPTRDDFVRIEKNQSISMIPSYIFTVCIYVSYVEDKWYSFIHCQNEYYSNSSVQSFYELTCLKVSEQRTIFKSDCFERPVLNLKHRNQNMMNIIVKTKGILGRLNFNLMSRCLQYEQITVQGLLL